jgi:hypothetical protein
LAEADGGIGTLADAEKPDAEVGGGIVMCRREQKRAAESAFGDAELDDHPAVAQIGGFAFEDGAGEQSGGFDDVAILKKGDGAGAWAARIRIGKRNRLFNGHGFGSGGFQAGWWPRIAADY